MNWNVLWIMNQNNELKYFIKFQTRKKVWKQEISNESKSWIEFGSNISHLDRIYQKWSYAMFKK